jgi:hypothetical protein
VCHPLSPAFLAMPHLNALGGKSYHVHLAA